MKSSLSVIEHYISPTSSLEIWGKKSVLSQWAKRPIIKDCQFELRFDDASIDQEKKLSIRGDREDLDSLCEVVDDYVQGFLIESPDEIPINSDNVKKIEETNSNVVTLPSKPYLKLRSLTSHELFFGSLANEDSGRGIILSSLQLFDLANNLEEYSREFAYIPKVKANSNKKNILVLTSSVAVVLLAIGLTNYQNIFPPESETESALNQAPSSETNVQEDIPSEVSPSDNTPSTNSPSDNSSSDAIGEESESESESQDIPPISLVPLPPTIEQPSLIVPPELAQKEQLPPPSPIRVPRNPIPQGITRLPVNSPEEQTDSSFTINPQAQQNSRRRDPILPNATSDELQDLNQPVSLPTLPPLAENSSNPDNLNLRNSTQIPNLPEIDPLSTDELVILQPNIDRDVTTNSESNSTNSSLEENNFTSIPQLAEAQSYFEQTWKPPENLNHGIQYRLILNKDGSIRRIIPLGQRAQIFLDRTGIPLLGEKFVSPLSGEKEETIRLVLNPDGKVSTFLE